MFGSIRLSVRLSPLVEHVRWCTKYGILVVHRVLTMVHNPDRWCTTQVDGTQCSSVHTYMGGKKYCVMWYHKLQRDLCEV